jgi:cobalt/nickel transport system permease protein
MHLGNGAITAECGVVALSVAAVGAGTAIWMARACGVDRARARTAGALGAAVFAAQMFNVQILPFSSVHLIGGVLLAWVLGPPLGALTMMAVLTLQAVLLGDGGLLALGVNSINMALLPAIVVAVARQKFAAASTRSPARTVALAAWTCTVAAAALIILEVSLGRSAAQLEGLGPFAARMIGWHAIAGILEAAATLAAIRALERVRERRGLLPHQSWALSSPGSAPAALSTQAALSARGAAIVAVVSLVVAVLSVPALGLASSAPDTYEAALAAARAAGFAVGDLDQVQQLSGFSGQVQSWQGELAALLPGPEMISAVLATVIAGMASWGCAAWLCGRSDAAYTP